MTTTLELPMQVDEAGDSRTGEAKGGSLHGLVTRPPCKSLYENQDEILDAIEYLQHQQGSLRQQNFKVHYQVTESDDTAAEIVATVNGIGADAIVMCTHGRGGLGRWLFGSVAARILQIATVPVLVMRPRTLPAPS